MQKFKTVGELRAAMKENRGEVSLGSGITVTMEVAEQTRDIDLKKRGSIIAWVSSAAEDACQLIDNVSVITGADIMRFPSAVAAFSAWAGLQDEDDERIVLVQTPDELAGKGPGTQGERIETVKEALEFSKGKVDAYEKILIGREISISK